MFSFEIDAGIRPGRDPPTLAAPLACCSNCTAVSCSCSRWIVSVCSTMHSVCRRCCSFCCSTCLSTAFASPCLFSFDGSVQLHWILMLKCVIILAHVGATVCLSHSQHASLRSDCTSKDSKTHLIISTSVTGSPNAAKVSFEFWRLL